MKSRMVFIVEGDSELSFVQERLIPYLCQNTGIYWDDMHAQKITTNRRLNTKGGVVNYQYLRNEIDRENQRGNVLITTLLDFFRLPNSFPGYTTDSGHIADIEQAVRDDMSSIISKEKFLPYIQRHEFESLLFTDIEAIKLVANGDGDVEFGLDKINQTFACPEDINGGSQTAPSKRLSQLFPYDKTSDSELILSFIPVQKICDKCPRFNAWMAALVEALKTGYFK